ncbi:MAG: eukaryotic-like serine/threonine-protein kinase [Myxococcales bacterium]|nr:eukaryotic-like serine/threonine-protein kinase [Myxococcales bacterium]
MTTGPVDALGLVGSTVDQVRFDACVDAGGFGLIYRGYHEGLGETVAIKCLRIASMQKTNEAIREALAGRFRDETKLLYRLSQGNLDIVRCISSGTLIAPTTQEYTPYMVLEWLDGCTLSAELKERRAQRLKPRTLDAAVQLLDSAVGGLAYAHAHDVVHRDVKPGNLFLTRTREGVRMKVLDFGLAKILSDESIGVRPSVETGVGVHFCSPSYGAPEQFSGTIGKIGPHTDVYSLTMVLLECMTGDKVRPAGSLADGLLKAIDPNTGSPSASSLGLHLPKAVEELLLRAVAQNPLERPRDAGVFWSELKTAIANAPKPNLSAATVMDDAVGDAMQAVRAAVARASQAPGPAPFTGTMLMQNAPQGAPHLVAHPALPTPAAGSPPGVSHGTAPLVAPMPSLGHGNAAPGSVPPPPGPDSVLQARQRGELLKGTLPIGAVSPMSGMSPLAASMAIASPLRNAAPGQGAPQQQPSAQQQQQQQQQQPQQQQSPSPQSYAPPPNAPRTHPPRTDPRMQSGAPAPLPVTSNAGAVIFVVLCLMIAIGGVAFYWVRTH